MGETRGYPMGIPRATPQADMCASVRKNVLGEALSSLKFQELRTFRCTDYRGTAQPPSIVVHASEARLTRRSCPPQPPLPTQTHWSVVIARPDLRNARLRTEAHSDPIVATAVMV